MGRKEKINNFKSITGINDNSLAEKYLIIADWDEEKAIQLYFKENSKNKINKNDNIKKDKQVQGKFEFKISEALYKTEEVYTQKEKDSFFDMIKFLEKNFYIAQNFNEFLSSLKKAAGLIIIFQKEKMTEVRNNMIRATNNALCLDILKSTIILPVMKDTQTYNELIKQFKTKDFPVYLFCKYNSSQIMTINNVVEKKFRLNNVVNNLLDCFPDNDVKQSVYKSINTSIIGFQNKKNKEKKENDDDFSGDENEVNNLINKLENDIKINNTLFVRDKTFEDYLANDKDKNQNNQEKKENSDNNKTENNRFQNLFNNDITNTQIFSDVKDKEENILDIPISSEVKLEKNENLIPKEPDENDPNSCKITFRYPYDEKHKQRRFNKTDKIEALYNYVKSLGREIFSNQNFQTFELIYGFPPINFENKKNNTLEEEGLFPSSTINIIEK